jgi:transglutaminase-like putative cysteine protease
MKTPRMPMCLLLVLSLVWLLAGTAASARTLTDTPLVLIDRDEAISMAAKVTSEVYPDADTVIVDSHTWVRYRDDGTYVQRDETFHKILTQEGVESLRSLSSWFTIPYNTTRFDGVEIIRSDGSVLSVDIEANSRVMIDRSQMDANIYNPNDKILNLNLPDLQVGDLVHYTIEDVFSKVRTPGSFSDLIPFEGTSPIIRKTHTLIGPASLPLARIAVRDRVGHTLTHTKKRVGEEIVHVWEGRDIPQVFPEPDMPSFHTVVQRVLVSTIPDWEWISRWYWELSKPHLDTITEPMHRKVRELVSDQADPMDRIRSIFTWVSQKVRYLGLTLEENAPGYEPHPVDMTFERRAGVCRDKAALLVAMLRSAGFEAYPVLIMSGPKKDPEVPQPFFNHAVSCVRMDDGTIVLMDATDEHSRELFPPYLNNCSYLVASPEGDPLRTSPVVSAAENTLSIETTGRLHEDGGIEASSRLRFNGINDSAYRGFFARAPREKQRSYFENALKKAYPGAELLSLDIFPENIMDTSEILSVTLGFRIPQALVGRGETLMLPLPPMGHHVGVQRMLVDRMGLEKRRFPLFTKYACGVEETVRIDLAGHAGELLSTPAPLDLRSKEANYMRGVYCKDGTLTVRHRFTLNLPEYTPTEYLDLKKSLARQEVEERAACLFAASDQPVDPAVWYGSFEPDAVILNHEVDVYVDSDHAWIRHDHVKKRILTYAGMKKNSEIQMDYTPPYEQVEIVNATVTGRDGSVTTIEPQEINRMDAPWVGEAPRYPAAKTLVAGLPGVEQGAVLDYILKHTVHKGDCFAMKEVVSGEYPVVRKTVRVHLPKTMQARIVAADQGWGLTGAWLRGPEQIIEQTREEDEHTVTHIFSACRVPPVAQENDLPPAYSFQPVVALTSGTWPGLARHLGERLDRAVLQGTQTAVLARDLTAHAATDLEKVRIVRDYVARNIALKGPGADTYPMDNAFGADSVLQAGYGCSADRAVVLYTMLRAVGLEPVFVATGNAPPVRALQEFMRVFVAREWLDHILVRVQANGREIYLNDTDEYAALGSTGLEGRAGVVLPDGGITVITVDDQMSDGLATDYVLDLEAEGDALVRMTRVYRGSVYDSYHRMFAEMSPEMAQRYRQEQASQISLNGKVTGYDRDFSTYPGRETMTVRVDRLGTRQGEFLYLNLPGMIAELSGVDGRTRTNPLYRDLDKQTVNTIRVNLPQETEDILVRPAGDLYLPLGDRGRVRVRTRILPSRSGRLAHVPPRALEIEIQARSKPMVVSPTAYGQLRHAEDILVENARGALVLDVE